MYNITPVLLLFLLPDVARGCGPGDFVGYGGLSSGGSDPQRVPGQYNTFSCADCFELGHSAVARRALSAPAVEFLNQLTKAAVEALEDPDNLPIGYLTVGAWVSRGGDPHDFRDLLNLADTNGDNQLDRKEMQLARQELMSRNDISQN